MSKQLKYVITDKREFALFTKASEHKDVANSLFGTPKGAGFCELDVHYGGRDVPIVNVIECHGESISLGVKSREEDVKIMNEYLEDN